MQFYTKVLTRFASNRDLKLTMEVKFTVEGDVSEQQKNDTKSALQELGLDDELQFKSLVITSALILSRYLTTPNN
jgi:hypothetical protein